MNIQRVGKWIVALAGGVLTVLGAAKSLREITSPLNPWNIMFLVGSLTALAIGIASYFEWIRSKFDKYDAEIRYLTGLDRDRGKRLLDLEIESFRESEKRMRTQKSA